MRPERRHQSAAEHHRGQKRFKHQRLAERLHQNGDLDRTAADAAVLFRERNAQPAEFGECRPHFGAEAAFAVGDLLEGVVAVMLGEKPLGGLAQHQLS